jgi:ankyrin repeat protein
MSYLNNNLINAVEENNLSEVKRAIDKGADVNCIDKYNTPVLMLAMTKGYYEIAKYFIEKKAGISTGMFHCMSLAGPMLPIWTQ